MAHSAENRREQLSKHKTNCEMEITAELAHKHLDHFNPWYDPSTKKPSTDIPYDKKITVWVESEEGAGSTFYINLPRINADQAARIRAEEKSTIQPTNTASG